MTVKRSLSIQGHRTSISVEDEFWMGLKAIAERRDQPLPAIVAEIDAGRSADTNLSSAIRLAVLRDVSRQQEPPALAPTARHASPLFSHVYLGTSDFSAAFAFWSPLLDALGHTPRFHDADAAWAGWQPVGADRPLFLIGRPHDRAPAIAGNGVMVAFLAAGRPSVDRVHAMALASGGVCEGPPGLRPHYHPHFYGAYFRDLDGNKLCVFKMG